MKQAEYLPIYSFYLWTPKSSIHGHVGEIENELIQMTSQNMGVKMQPEKQGNNCNHVRDVFLHRNRQFSARADGSCQ